MRWIDTHCHLCHGRLQPQADAVLDRACAAGVEIVICAAANLDESAAASALASRREGVYCIAGVHPHEAKDAPADYLEKLAQLAAADRNVAVGEIGLDYHYNFSPPADQQRVFAEQLDLARRLGKRVAIHTREAMEDTMAILGASGVDGASVVFHSFTEGVAGMRRVLDFGAMVSFSGIVTFGKSAELRASAEIAPLDRILVETDSPFLSPEPLRKMKTNEPANVVHVGARLASLRGVAPQQMAEITSADAARFFGLPAGA